MKNTVLALAVVTLSVCFGLAVQKAETSTAGAARPMTVSAGKGLSMEDRGPVSADINDSAEFFQNAIKIGPEPDNSQGYY